ncbi:MAG: S1C family serine protease [Planctomycetota bacterium]|jgi:serine protease Do
MWTILSLIALQGTPTPPPAPEPPTAPAISALEQLEKDLISLHAGLRASLVSVRVPLRAPLGELDATAELVTSGTVLDNEGLVVIPLDLRPEFPAEAVGEITIYRADGRAFAGRLLATNPAYGLSLVRAPELRGLAPKFGHGSWHEEGSLVFSLGNAYGLPASLNTGVLAGKRRSIGDAAELLQITNPINQGDAGGILANRHGEVIAILLTSLATEAAQKDPRELMAMEPAERQEWLLARQAEGVSFAVPVEFMPLLFPEHLPTMSQMRRLGVMVEVELSVIEEDGKEPGHRWQIVVTGLAGQGPALDAGIQPGDIILSLDGKRTESLYQLGRAIVLAPEDADLVILRDSETLTLPVSFRLPWVGPSEVEEDASAEARDD